MQPRQIQKTFHKYFHMQYITAELSINSTTTPQLFYGPLLGPLRSAGVRRELLDFMVQGKINSTGKLHWPSSWAPLHPDAHLYHPSIFYRPDSLPAIQPTVSKHWRQLAHSDYGEDTPQQCYLHHLHSQYPIRQSTKENDNTTIHHSELWLHDANYKKFGGRASEFHSHSPWSNHWWKVPVTCRHSAHEISNRGVCTVSPVCSSVSTFSSFLFSFSFHGRLSLTYGAQNSTAICTTLLTPLLLVNRIVLRLASLRTTYKQGSKLHRT